MAEEMNRVSNADGSSYDYGMKFMRDEKKEEEEKKICVGSKAVYWYPIHMIDIISSWV